MSLPLHPCVCVCLLDVLVVAAPFPFLLTQSNQSVPPPLSFPPSSIPFPLSPRLDHHQHPPIPSKAIDDPRTNAMAPRKKRRDEFDFEGWKGEERGKGGFSFSSSMRGEAAVNSIFKGRGRIRSCFKREKAERSHSIFSSSPLHRLPLTSQSDDVSNVWWKKPKRERKFQTWLFPRTHLEPCGKTGNSCGIINWKTSAVDAARKR